MTQDDIIRMAREAGLDPDLWNYTDAFERFAQLVAAHEREKVAKWMIDRSYATGHGDTIEDLLKELEWQVREREREACAKVCEQDKSKAIEWVGTAKPGWHYAQVIRARGTK